MIDGKGITGQMLLTLAEQYVDAFNNGGCPEIKSSLERALHSETQQILKEKMAKFQQYLSAKLTNNPEKSTESFFKIYKDVLKVLDEDTWSSCKRRKIEDLFLPIKSKICQELEKDFSDYLASQSNKKQRFYQSLVTKFEENLGMPQSLKFDKFFDEARLHKFHQGMIEWVRKSLKDDSQISVTLLEKICQYYEHYTAEAKSVALLEIEKKNDDLEIEKKTSGSYKEMIQVMEKNSEDLKDRMRRYQLESERLDREVDILRKSQSSNNDGMFLRVTTLEQQCDDLKNENSLLENKILKLRKELDQSKKSGSSGSGTYKGLSYDPYNPTQDTELSQNSRDELNQIEYHLSEMAANKKLSGSSSSDFLEIFEKYKAAMQKEMMSMRKNMTFVLQENNQLKSQILESNKKEGHYQQIEQQFQQLKKETAEYANSVNAKQKEEEFTHMLVENRTLKSQKPLLNYVLQETIKKLKKKKNSLENALDMLSPEDLQSVLEVYDSLELKWKFKLEGQNNYFASMNVDA